MPKSHITYTLFLTLATVMTLQAGPAENLFKAGNDAYSAEDYPKAIESYQKITTSYASASIINDVKLRLGQSYLYSGKYAEAVDILSKLTDRGNAAQTRELALFYLGQAQLSLSGILTNDEKARQTNLTGAVTSFTQLITSFPKSDLREDAYYNRALANFFLAKYGVAEKDFTTLTDEFPSSVNKADYIFWLARTYGSRATKTLIDKKPKNEAHRWAAKAKETYARISNADGLILANDAAFESAELDFYLSEKDGYTKAIAEYNKVRRREDLLPGQKAKIDAIRAKIAEAGRAGNKVLAESLGRLRTREQARLNDLEGRVDMAIKAAMRKAQCYVLLGRHDEARVILHRLNPFVTDNEDKKDVNFQIILSYALQKLVDKANIGLDAYLKEFPGDKDADIISFQLGNTFMGEKQYQDAFDQYARSLKDFPKGRYADQATLRQAAAMSSMGQLDKAMAILNDFVTKNPTSPSLGEAQYTLGFTQMTLKKFDDAARNFRAVKNNPQAAAFESGAAFQLAIALYQAKQLDAAIQELKAFIQKHPNQETTASAALHIGMALDLKKDPAAMRTLQEVTTKYPKDNATAYALNYIASILKRENKIPEMIATYQKVYKSFPQSKEAVNARTAIAAHYVGLKKYDAAAEMYQEIRNSDDKASAGYGAWAEGDMWLRASREYGAYSRITEAEQKETRRRLENAEKSYITLLKEYPDAKETNYGLKGLLDLALLQSDYGLLANEQIDKFFTDIINQISDPTTRARLQLLQAAVPYEQNRRDDAYAHYTMVLQANPEVPLTPGDARRFGELLIERDQADAAINLFTQLQHNADLNDALTMSEVYYGLGSASLAKKDYPKAKDNLDKIVKQYAWHPKAANAKFGLAEIAHAQKDNATAKTHFESLIRNQRCAAELKAASMIQLGDIYAQEGQLLAGPDKSRPNAAAYYLKTEIYFGDALPEIGALALWKAGQLYEKAGQTADARKQYEEIAKKYKKTPYAPKAAERLSTLPAK